MRALTYSKAGVTPADWFDLKVFDLDSGQEVLDCAEVNTRDGWAIAYERNEAGEMFVRPLYDHDAGKWRYDPAKRTLVGRYEIRRAS